MNKSDYKTTEGRRSEQGLSSIAQTLMPFAKKLLGKKGFVEIDILTGWDKIVGAEMAKYSLPQRIHFPRDAKNGGTLYLSVPSGAFALEIQHREKYILDKINTYFGYNAVSAIRIIQNQPQNSLQTGKQIKPEDNNEITLPPEDEKHIENLTEAIDNPELKAIIAKLGRDIYNKKSEKK